MNILDRIIKTSIYVLVFLLPLFFLPFSFEALEYSKQYLLFFLVSLAFLAWITKMVLVDKEICFRKRPLDLFILAFLAAGVLSAIFSVDKSSSLYGFYGRFSNGLIGLLTMGVLYFLITNNTKAGKDDDGGRSLPLKNRSLIRIFICSSFFAAVAGFFSIFGIWAKIGSVISLPQMMMQRTFNTVAGSLESLSIFLAVALMLIVGLMVTKQSISRLRAMFNWVLFASILVLLLIVNFESVWIMLLISSVLFVFIGVWIRFFRENVNRLLIPIFLIIVSGVCLAWNPAEMVFGQDSDLSNLPQEQVLNQRTSWGIGLDSATNDVKSAVVGTGIGTFHYDFAMEKPVEINNTWLWQIRFDRSGSHLAGILGTMGFLGLTLYSVVILLVLMMSCLFMAKLKSALEVRPSYLPLFLVFLTLLVGQFVFYQNTAMAFAFWLFLGLLVVAMQSSVSEKRISFKDFPELSLVFSTIVIIIVMAVLVLCYFGGKFYLADVKYASALSLLGDERIERMEKAAELNPQSPRYRAGLARTYLNEALVETIKPQQQQDPERFQLMVAKAIDEAKNAVFLQPNLVSNWEILGVIYREIGGVAAGATEWGIESFESAIALEPTNPVLYTELAKLYLSTGDAEKAKEFLYKAIEKKSDYSDAKIQLALLLESEEILDEAIAELEGLVSVNPFNIEASFQLGRLYFNNKRIDEAINQFAKIVLLEPEHSNAHYSLGVAYIAKGENDLAIREFEKVLELNPGNQDVIQKIKTLMEE